VPDGITICDSCLKSALDLKSAYAVGCNCCELEEDAVTEASALAAIRGALDGTLRFERYYVTARTQYYDKEGKPTDDVLKASVTRTKSFYCVMDASVPFAEREPIEEFEGHPGWDKARKLVNRLNKEVT
jgi:hypothetical protein